MIDHSAPSRHETEKQARKDATAAAGWRYDPRLELVCRMRDERPEEYARLSPTAKTSAGYYLTGKTAAANAGHDTTGSTA